MDKSVRMRVRGCVNVETRMVQRERVQHDDERRELPEVKDCARERVRERKTERERKSARIKKKKRGKRER